MTVKNDPQEYHYSDGNQNSSHKYLLPQVKQALSDLTPSRMFDLGCGNGSVAKYFSDAGWTVTGVDPSEKGVTQAQANFPELDLHLGSAYDDLPNRFGNFPVVLSLEVVEHLYAPRTYAKTVFDLLEPGGRFVLSTPYHGYLKNVVLAVTGKMDAHFTALWDHGHIKFWSERTLAALLAEVGFVDIRFSRAGRIPPLAKSMIAVARKPREVQGSALPC